jgi:(p)ppGpp synthase/HD superfamily hydrolase
MNIWKRDLYIKAWHFATQKHEGQTYGGAKEGERINYLNHIGTVTMEVIWCLEHTSKSYNADLAIQCAILHDTIEDTNTSYKEIEENFGVEVANGVLALSKNMQLPTKREQMLDSLERILQQPQEVAMVKLADRVSNLYHPPFYWDKKKILEYIDEAELIANKLQHADILLLERLQERIQKYHQFAQ